jgi:hypothetical protein
MKFSTSRFTWAYLVVPFLVLITTCILFTPAHAQDNVTCASICPDDTQDITNPDQTVTYDWNARIPVPSSTIGETVQTYTCAEFDVRLTTFDESDCTKHQQGLQEAGCTCGSGASFANIIVSLVSTVGCMLLATVVCTWM